MDFDFAASGWDGDGIGIGRAVGSKHPLLGNNFLDEDGGRSAVGLDFWVHGHSALNGGKPQTSVASFPTGGFRQTIALDADQSVCATVGRAVDGVELAPVEVVQSAPAHAEDTLATTHPEIAEVVFEDFVNLVAEKSLGRSVGGKLAVRKPVEAATARS